MYYDVFFSIVVYVFVKDLIGNIYSKGKHFFVKTEKL